MTRESRRDDTRASESQPVRSDQDQSRGTRRRTRLVRSDASEAHRHHGGGQPATGVSPRSPVSSEQRVDERPGYAHEYGNVAPGRYDAHDDSVQPAHAGAYAADANAQLRELIIERLTEDPQIDAREVTIEVRDGAVRLDGTVASARLRGLIEGVVENCGASRVINQLQIGEPGPGVSRR